MLKLLGYNLLYVHILPGSHLSFVLPPKQGLNSNQNKGHLGSRYPVQVGENFLDQRFVRVDSSYAKSRVNYLERSFPKGKTPGYLGRYFGCCDTFMWTSICARYLRYSEGKHCGTTHYDSVFGILHLGGGSPLFGEDSHFDQYFSDGLKPPTSHVHMQYTSKDLYWFITNPWRFHVVFSHS